MAFISTCLLLATSILSAPPVTAPDKPAAAVAAPTKDTPAPARGIQPPRLVGFEDVVFLSQVAGAGGAAAVAGLVVVVPALVFFPVVAITALLWNNPWLLLVLPVGAGAVGLLGQALAAGVSVWLIGFFSEHFQARTYVPPLLSRLVTRRLGVNLDRGVWKSLLGAPWMTGAAGYLMGAGLGAAVAMAMAAPLVGASVLLAQSPPDNEPGVLALLGGGLLGLGVLGFFPVLTAPLGAAVAHHLTKEVQPVTSQPVR